MKKFLMLIAISLCMISCDNDEPVQGMPEGTGEVTINEENIDVTGKNIVNWTQYSVQVANLLSQDAISLRDAWKVNYKGEPYAETFKNPGIGKAYTSYSNCLQEIIEGCADIANEVGTAKIGEPRDMWENGDYTGAVYAVESWYSFHSIDDYSNNVLSIRNAFRGSCNGEIAENSIAAYLRREHVLLYDEINGNIELAYNAIQTMAAPFRSHIGNSSVTVAQKACAKLEHSLTNQLEPVMMAVSEDILKPIVENYVDNVVLPTYDKLVELNTALNTAIRQLANDPTDAHFVSAANAWLKAREPWETSEAFLFGPVADLGLDPNMDSWPLDVVAIKNTLSSGKFDNLTWEGEFDEDDETISATQNVRGFHTLEFLLFQNGQPRRIK